MSTTNESNLEEMVKSTLAQLSTQEMIDCLSGETSFYRGSSVMLSPNWYASRPWIAARKEKLGLPGVKFVDGPRGIILKGGTTFPVSTTYRLNVASILVYYSILHRPTNNNGIGPIW